MIAAGSLVLKPVADHIMVAGSPAKPVGMARTARARARDGAGASRDADAADVLRRPGGAFYTLVPIRPRWRSERRSLRTLPGVFLRPPLAFNPRPRRLSTPTDAFQLHPDVRSYGTTWRTRSARRRRRKRRRRARGCPSSRRTTRGVWSRAFEWTTFEGASRARRPRGRGRRWRRRRLRRRGRDRERRTTVRRCRAAGARGGRDRGACSRTTCRTTSGSASERERGWRAMRSRRGEVAARW